MEKIEKVDKRSPTEDSKKVIKSLQTCHEGNKIYVITYFMDKTVLIKMYERTMMDGAYDYVGAVEVA